MAKTPKPAPSQQQGTQAQGGQMSGSTPAPAAPQQGTPIIRDWASI